MNIKDVKDAMDDLLEAHGCEEDYAIYTATGEPIDGFDFGEDGQLYVFNSKGEIADSKGSDYWRMEYDSQRADNERLRKQNKRLYEQREFYKGYLERYQEVINELHAEIEEKDNLLSEKCAEYDELDSGMYDAYNEILRGKNGRALSIIEDYGREHCD